MKKIISLLLCVQLLVSLAMPASAANNQELLDALNKLIQQSNAASYTHDPSGAVLSIPAGWKVQVKSDTMTVFTCEGASTALMTMQSQYLVDSQDPDRAVNNDDFSPSEIGKILDTSASNVKEVTLGDQEYFYAKTTQATTVKSKKVTLTLHSWICIVDNWFYLYRFTGERTHDLYEDFQDLVSSAVYGGSSAVSGDTSYTERLSHLGGIYCGPLAGGVPQGEGTLTWGKCSYTGQFEGGYPSGSGSYTCYNGCILEGNNWGWLDQCWDSWQPGRKGADMFYTGLTLNGDAHGYGTLDFYSGGIFEGEFMEGDPCGWGIYTYLHPSSEKNACIEGENWVTKHGEKRLKNEYYGLKLGKKWQGFGIGILKSGYAYCGEIRNDYRDGYGELYTKKDALERHGLYKKGEYSKKISK